MLEPAVDDVVGHVVCLDGLLKNLSSTVELAAHDRVPSVDSAHPATFVIDLGAKQTRGELVLASLQPGDVDASKEEADHGVAHHPVDERVDDGAQGRFAEALEGVHAPIVAPLRLRASGLFGTDPPMIRPATLDDHSALVAGNIAIAKETEDVVLDPELIGAGVRRLLEDPQKGRYFVGIVDGRVVAQLMITLEWSDWRNADVWWIQSVYVFPDARRQGWYRRLYEHVQAEAKAAGAAGIRLYVDLRNTSAQTVYAKLGMNGEHYKMFEAMFDGP